jgi:hypothetical protein
VPVPSTRIEDALYEASCVALCIAYTDDDVPVAAIQLGAPIDLAAISTAVASLPEYARPKKLRVIVPASAGGSAIPLTDGFRPIKRGVRDLPASEVYVWDSRAQRYEDPRTVSRAG